MLLKTLYLNVYREPLQHKWALIKTKPQTIRSLWCGGAELWISLRKFLIILNLSTFFLYNSNWWGLSITYKAKKFGTSSTYLYKTSFGNFNIQNILKGII